MQVVFPESVALEASEPIEMSSQLFSVYHQREKPLPAVENKSFLFFHDFTNSSYFLVLGVKTPGSFDMIYN